MSVIDEDCRPIRYGGDFLHSARGRLDFSKNGTRFFDRHTLAEQQGKNNHRVRDIELARQWQSDLAIAPRAAQPNL